MSGERNLLLVDDEPNILRALKRLLRRDGYSITTANSGKEGLECIKQQDFGVIVSDQRMPEMNGTEFFAQAKEIAPDTVRIILSGYTDLKSITNSINEGAIYKFFTKPWDDEQLKENVRKAFEYHELSGENKRLQQELRATNQELEQSLKLQTKYASINLKLLETAQDILQHLPYAVIGIDSDDQVVMVNEQAIKVFGGALMPGLPASECLPKQLAELTNSKEQALNNILLGDCDYRVRVSNLISHGQNKGKVLSITPVNV